MLGSVYYFNLSGLSRCIITLDRDPGANKSKWLGLPEVLLQVGNSFHPLIARIGLRALVPGQCPQYIWMTGGFGSVLCHSNSSEIFAWLTWTFQQCYPRIRSLWECRGNIYVLPRPLLDRAQIPQCRRAMRLRFGKKVLTDTASWKESDPHAQCLPKMNQDEMILHVFSLSFPPCKHS